MAQIIAYCGLDCGKCPAYIATQKGDKKDLAKTAKWWAEQFKVQVKPEDVVCDGCPDKKSRKASYCAVCEIRNCCLGKGNVNCAFCEEYICGKLGKFLEHAQEAKENLQKIKK